MRAYQGAVPIGGRPQGFRPKLTRREKCDMLHFGPTQALPPRKCGLCRIFANGKGDLPEGSFLRRHAKCPLTRKLPRQQEALRKKQDLIPVIPLNEIDWAGPNIVWKVEYPPAEMRAFRLH